MTSGLQQYIAGYTVAIFFDVVRHRVVFVSTLKCLMSVGNVIILKLNSYKNTSRK